MGTIIFLTGETMGDALASSGSALDRVFKRLGYDFVTINFATTGALDRLNAALANGGIEFVFSHVGIGMDMVGNRPDGSKCNIWQEMRIPFISFNGDTPAYFFDRHVVPGPTFACLYTFPEHCRMRKRLPAVRGMTGVTPPVVQDALPASAVDFKAKARGKLLFLKNGNDPEALVASWRSALPANLFVMLTDLASELASRISGETGNDIDALVTSYFRDRGMEVEAMARLRLLAVAQLDDYLRRLKSTLVAEALLDFPIEIHGFNWGHVDFSGRRARLVEHANYGESRQLILDSLGIIDMSPNTGLAPHDRPMRAIARHTLCMTNEQAFFRTKVPALADQFSYRFEAEHLRATVEGLLADPRRTVETGAEVAKHFARGYEIDVLAQYMLDVAAALRIEYMERPAGFPPFFAWPPTSLA